MRASPFALLIAILLLLPLAPAQGQEGDELPPPLAYATVRGYVTDPDGAPIAANVTSPQARISFAPVATNATGHYELEVVAGNVALVAIPTDLARGVVSFLDECSLEDCTLVPADGVVWRNLTLPWGGHIEGTVRLPDGTPAEGARLQTYPNMSSYEYHDVVLPADGRYRVLVAAGEHMLLVYPPEGAPYALPHLRVCQNAPQDECVPVSARGTTWLNVTLREGGVAEVTVLGPDGAPATAANVQLWEAGKLWPDEGASDPSETDLDGVARIRAAPGRYAVQAEQGEAGLAWSACEAPDAACIDLVAGRTTPVTVRLLPRTSVHFSVVGAEANATTDVHFHADGARDRIVHFLWFDEVFGADPAAGLRKLLLPGRYDLTLWVGERNATCAGCLLVADTPLQAQLVYDGATLRADVGPLTPSPTVRPPTATPALTLPPSATPASTPDATPDEARVPTPTAGTPPSSSVTPATPPEEGVHLPLAPWLAALALAVAAVAFRTRRG